jgi:hypothetical protein
MAVLEDVKTIPRYDGVKVYKQIDIGRQIPSTKRSFSRQDVELFLYTRSIPDLCGLTFKTSLLACGNGELVLFD